MKKILLIMICVILLFLTTVSADEVNVAFDDFLYMIKVGENIAIDDVIILTGAEGYEIEKEYFVYDETYGKIIDGVFRSRRVGTANITAVYHFTDGEVSFDKYATVDIRISKNGSIVQTVDTDLNGIINSDDLSMLLHHYGTDEVICDFNGDKIVDNKDLSILLHRYGKEL